MLVKTWIFNFKQILFIHYRLWSISVKIKKEDVHSNKVVICKKDNLWFGIAPVFKTCHVFNGPWRNIPEYLLFLSRMSRYLLSTMYCLTNEDELW